MTSRFLYISYEPLSDVTYRVGDLPPDISIIGRPNGTINKSYQLVTCINLLIHCSEFMVNISAKIFKLCSHTNAKHLITIIDHKDSFTVQ